MTRLRLRSLFHRREVERELEDELAFHLAMQETANRDSGMSEGEAQLAARARFGGVSQTQEACRDHILGWIESLGQDLRYTVRSLRRSPGFSTLVVLMLAFGIGTNVTVFAIVHTVLLEPLPYREPDRLVAVSGAYSVPAYEFYSANSPAFSGVAAWVDESMTLAGSGIPERVRGARASASFFPVLGVEPLLGRGFDAEEDRPGGAKVALLAYNTWRNRFAGDIHIVGKSIRVNAESPTVVGVLPSSFWFPGEPVEVWVPRVADNRFISEQMIRDGAGILTDILARLRPGVSMEQAQASIRVLNAQYNKLYPGNLDAHLEPLERTSNAAARPSLLLLWCSAGCLLLVTCANTASLLLARATARSKEMAVRLALGASRGRLARQLLTETAPFAVCGGLLGLALAHAGVAGAAALGGHDLVGWRPIEMGGAVLGFVIAVSVISALLVGLAPALRSLRSSAPARVRSALVVVETALAVTLTLSAGLLLQSYVRMRTLRTGVHSEGLVTAVLRLPDARYGAPALRVRFYDELLRRIAGLPGVAEVGAASALHLQSKGEGSMTWPEGSRIGGPNPPIVRNRSVSPGYFQALGIPAIEGRQLTARDNASSAKVMLVNQAFVRTFFPDGRALGRHVTYSSEHVTCEIVGVVADVRPRMTDAAAQPEMYFPYMQRSRHEISLVIRSTLTAAALARAIRRELGTVDPDQSLYDVATMEDVMSGVLDRPRSTMSLVALFSAAALALVAIGIYGVLSFTVARRRREIGIRLALGAQDYQIRSLVVRQSIILIAWGIAAGVPAALALSRFASTLLFGISPADPATIGAVIGIAGCVGMVAAYLPARRATKVDPVTALAAE